ncbi:hypothetical protein ACFL1Y_01205 [Patescibacteria group bacterium]
MKDLTAFMAAGLMLIFAIRYGYQMYKTKTDVEYEKRIDPALSTWLILLTGTILSWLSYAVAENRDFKTGILNTVDFVAIVLIIIFILLWGNRAVRFKPFEKKYLYWAGGMVVFWAISWNAFVMNLLVQILMVGGYFPTIKNMRMKQKNTESFSGWIIVIVAAMIALYPASVKGNLLSMVYAGKTIVMAGVILYYMVHYQKKESIQ